MPRLSRRTILPLMTMWMLIVAWRNIQKMDKLSIYGDIPLKKSKDYSDDVVITHDSNPQKQWQTIDPESRTAVVSNLEKEKFNEKAPKSGAKRSQEWRISTLFANLDKPVQSPHKEWPHFAYDYGPRVSTADSQREFTQELEKTKQWSNNLPSNTEIGYFSMDKSLPYPLSMTCTMDSCFDYRKCRGIIDQGLSRRFLKQGLLHTARVQPKFYIYEVDKISKLRWNMQNYFTPLWNHPLRTKNASEACLFFPSLDFLCSGNLCLLNNATSALESLAYWDHGRNHVIIAENDFEPQQYARKINLSTWDRAILVSTNHRSSHHRWNFDIAIPLPPRWRPLVPDFDPNNETMLDEVSPPISKRKYLITFKGTRYNGCGNPVRGLLRWIHNGKDVIMASKCGYKRTKICMDDEVIYNSTDFMETLVNSKFGLVPRGCGRHSYRLADVLSVKVVPVILADEFVPPHYDLMKDWKRCAIQIPESQIRTIIPYLRSIPDVVIEERLKACRRVWKAWYGGARKYTRPRDMVHATVDTIIENVASRIY